MALVSRLELPPVDCVDAAGIGSRLALELGCGLFLSLPLFSAVGAGCARLSRSQFGFGFGFDFISTSSAFLKSSSMLESPVLAGVDSVSLKTIRRFAMRSKRSILAYINGLTEERREVAEKHYKSHRRETRYVLV